MANTKVTRTYGKERTLGDILFNKENKSVFASIDAGFFGKVTLTLTQDQSGGYAFHKAYTTKDGSQGSFICGKTFPVKNKAGEVIEGLTQGLFGLIKEFDAATQKTLTSNKDGIQITTHKLREPKPLGTSGFLKVGYLTGKFAIEVPDGAQPQVAEPSSSAGGDDEEEIPF